MLEKPMIDGFGRAVTYLRVSVTDRCDFRCVYCMSENMTFLPKKDLLTLEELDRVCTVFVKKGVRKLRLTGGEPLVRKNIMSLFESLSRHLRSGQLRELTLTTNGSQLPKYAKQLRDCGVERVNISLDTLDPSMFRKITRWGEFADVMKGIDAAEAAGLAIGRGGGDPRKERGGGGQGDDGPRDSRHDRVRSQSWYGPHVDRDHALGRHRRRSH